MKNKKGAEMTVGTIIIIVLALIVLVVLVYGFTTGWGNLWAKITGFFGGTKSNLATVVQGCKVACASGSTVDYCKTQTVTKDDGTKGPATCKSLEGAANGLEACDAISC